MKVSKVVFPRSGPNDCAAAAVIFISSFELVIAEKYLICKKTDANCVELKHQSMD